MGKGGTYWLHKCKVSSYMDTDAQMGTQGPGCPPSLSSISQVVASDSRLSVHGELPAPFTTYQLSNPNPAGIQPSDSSCLDSLG